MAIKTAPKATSIDIAFKAGVSQSTVSRALSGSKLVSDETRAKIRAIAEELNYKVDKNASGLRSQSSRTLALLLFEDPTTDDSHINPFFLSMLGAITRATALKGYDLLVSFQQLSHDWYADYEETSKADGLILLGYGDYLSIQENLKKLADAGAHFILWGPVIENQPWCVLGCDNFWGSYQATQHLLNLGRKRIAFLGSASQSEPEFQARYNGFQSALTEAGLEQKAQIPCESTEGSGMSAAEALISSDVDGIICASDLIAIGAIRALKAAGKRIPEEISICGFDDIATAKYMSPSLTTVRQSTTQAGEELVESLLSIISGNTVASQLFKPELVIRESCGADTGVNVSAMTRPSK